MEQNLPPLPPVIFENGLYYELRGEQYYPCLLPPESDTTGHQRGLEGAGSNGVGRCDEQHQERRA